MLFGSWEVIMQSTVFLFSLLGVAALILSSFLPLMALNYYIYRRPRRQEEIDRILKALYGEECGEDRPISTLPQFALPVFFAWLLSLLGLGLTAVVFGSYLVATPGAADEESHRMLLETATAVATVPMLNAVNEAGMQALLMVCMAFLGAYLWAAQDIFSRYSVSYLRPAAYYSLSLRMVFACAIALLVYHTVSALGDTDALPAGLLPVLAFLIGSFPQRGVQLLRQRIPFFRQSGSPAVDALPLSMIQGTTAHDELCFSELGIDNCYELANANFIPLLFDTPYSGRQVIDWLLQAKLCVFAGAEVRELRQRGFRTIIEVGKLKDDEDIRQLASDTRLTELCLRQVRDMVVEDRWGDIERMCKAAHIVSRYWPEDSGSGADRRRQAPTEIGRHGSERGSVHAA